MRSKCTTLPAGEGSGKLAPEVIAKSYRQCAKRKRALGVQSGPGRLRIVFSYGAYAGEVLAGFAGFADFWKSPKS